MYWPDTGTGVDTEPARKPVASAVRKYFTEGGVGVPPTVPGGDWYNAITNEVLNVLDAAGIDPSKTDDDQLLQAIQWHASESESLLRQQLAGPGGSGLVGGQPVFVTAEKYAGGATTSSNNNDAAIIAAIVDAIETGNVIYWPDVYEVQGSIQNFHSVIHIGPGGILRGGKTLYAERPDVVGELYASVAGTSGGDGITSDHPMTLNQCMAAVEKRLLQNRASRNWVYLEDGTYPPLSSDARFDVGAARWFTKVFGSSPSACSIDGGGAPLNLAVVRGAGAKLWFENIHFKNTLGASFLVAEGAVGQMVNCNQTDCYYGMSGSSHSDVYMSGGTHHFTAGFGGYTQFRSIFLCKHYVGYKYDEDLGYGVPDAAGSCPKFTTDSVQGRGFFAQENSTGHVRCDLITGYSNGIELVSSSRAHLEDTLSIEKCSRAAEIESGCNIFDAGVNWNARGINKNGTTIRYLGGVVTSTTQGSVRQRLGFKDVTGTTITDTVATPIGLDFPTDGVSNNAGCTFTVTLTGTITGVLGKKDFALQHSSGFCGRVVFPSTAQGPFRLEIGFIKTAGDFILPVGLGVAGGFSGDAGVGESGASADPINRAIDGGPGTLDVLAFVEIAGDSISLNAATLHFEG